MKEIIASLSFEYSCPECDIRELSFHLIVKKKCENCKQFMETTENIISMEGK